MMRLSYGVVFFGPFDEFMIAPLRSAKSETTDAGVFVGRTFFGFFCSRLDRLFSFAMVGHLIW
jgi:hypothetical protein